jgi:hypothetical protein
VAGVPPLGVVWVGAGVTLPDVVVPGVVVVAVAVVSVVDVVDVVEVVGRPTALAGTVRSGVDFGMESM